MAADSAGHIGYWHPGLLPLRPKGWDERLPYPGTGEAEWRGPVAADADPARHQPQAGLAGQLEQPAVGRLDFGRRDGAQAHRRRVLPRRAAVPARASGSRASRPSRGMQDLIHARGDHGAAVPGGPRPTRRRGARPAQRKGGDGAGHAARVGRLLRADGARRHGRPRRRDVGRVPRTARAPDRDLGSDRRRTGSPTRARSGSLIPATTTARPTTTSTHPTSSAFALRTLSADGYRIAAGAPFAALAQRFGSTTRRSGASPGRCSTFEAPARRLAPAAAVLRPRHVGAARRARALTGTGSRTRIGGEARFPAPRARSRLRAMNSTRTLMNGGGWWRRWLGGRRREIHYRGAHIAGGQAVTPAVALSAYRHLT